MRRIFHTGIALMLMAVLALTAGCAALQERDTGAQLTVQYATLKVIEQSDDVTAEGVIEHVQRARALVDEDPDVTLGQLAEEVRSEIPWSRLSLADRMLLDAVLLEAEERLRQRIGDGLLDEDARVAVTVLFDWIERAASMAVEG